MSKAQRNVLAILLTIVFLDLAISQRLVKVWKDAFTAAGS